MSHAAEAHHLSVRVLNVMPCGVQNAEELQCRSLSHWLFTPQGNQPWSTDSEYCDLSRTLVERYVAWWLTRMFHH